MSRKQFVADQISEAGLIGLPGSRAEHEKALVAGEVPQGVDRVEFEEARRAMREVLAEFVECA